jgi:hypothetical protein
MTGALEGGGRMDIPEVAHTTLEDHLVRDSCLAGIDVDVKVLGVGQVDLNPRLLRSSNYGLLFPTDGVVK